MLSAQAKRALDVGLANLDSSNEIEALLSGATRNIYFVDTVNGSNSGYNGQSWRTPFATVAYALSVCSDEDTVIVRGDIREQNVTVAGLCGIRLIGATPGRPRNATSSGVAIDGLGASWREKAVAGNNPLLVIQGQGWEVRNILFTPQSGYSAIQLLTSASVDSISGGHAIIAGNKFISSGQVGYALEDNGGAYHVLVENNEFMVLEYAWKQTSVAADNPTSNVFRGNTFRGNKYDLKLNAEASVFEKNKFCTPYNVTTHPTTLDLVGTQDCGSAANVNYVVENYFADAAADVVIAKGYKPATGDVWRNYVTNSAAQVVTVPS